MQIDYGDHFKGFDPSISSFNFLTYSEADWAPFQSRFQYVNRLRHSEYLQLFREAGFQLLSDQPDRRPPERHILGPTGAMLQRLLRRGSVYARLANRWPPGQPIDRTLKIAISRFARPKPIVETSRCGRPHLS